MADSLVIEVNDSILRTVRKMIGPSHDCDVFDVDLISHINTIFSTLNQLGVGPKEGYEITGETETWSDFIGSDKRFNAVKSYMYLKTKLLFDPPASSVVLASMEKLALECEWRLNVNAES
jgi:hypothetical protein